MAHRIGEKWKDFMGVTISFADGSSARVSAINQSLSHYRPSYMHFWQLKTFWVEGILCHDDIECHSFEEITTQPALAIDQTPNVVKMTVAAMQQFRSEFECIMEENENENTNTDLADFWLRKTKKPVLAILLVQKTGSAPKLYRGTNMEVSMPTGSLCAERNVIGSALADDITLRRQDLKVIAVYSARSLEKPKPKEKEKEKNDTSSFISVSQAGSASAGGGGGGAETYVMDVNTMLTSNSSRPSSASSASSAMSQGTESEYEAEGAVSDSSEVGFGLGIRIETSLGNGNGNEHEHEHEHGLLNNHHDRHLSIKRKWSETSADSNSNSTDFEGSPTTSYNKTPRSPVIQGQKRKILSMPNQPQQQHVNSQRVRVSSSSSSSSSNRNSSKNGIKGTSVRLPSPATATATNLQSITPSSSSMISAVGLKRSSFSSGGLLGVDYRHDIFNQDEHYEPETEDDSGGGGGGYSGPEIIRRNISTNSLNNNSSIGISIGTSTRSFIVDESDMNPLKPCGACKEWLKKIAAVNPQFTVITFTDYNCEGVFLEAIDEST